MFNFCTRGVPNSITCAGGLIFDPLKGQCDYSDQVDRLDIDSIDTYDKIYFTLHFYTFTDQVAPQMICSPSSVQNLPQPMSTVATLTLMVIASHVFSVVHIFPDCSKFYLCVIGKARSQTCSQGLVFNPDTLSCEEQDTVTGPCSAFYNQTFLESLSTPPPALSPSITAGNCGDKLQCPDLLITPPGRVISQEGRRRPSRPQSVSRRPVGNFLPQPQQELPQEQIPQQLLDLQDFGQTGEKHASHAFL